MSKRSKQLQWNYGLSVCVLLHHSVQFIMQVSLRINVCFWTSDKEVLILLNHTLNRRNPLWNIKCPSELLIFALGQKQLGLDTRLECLTQSNNKLKVLPIVETTVTLHIVIVTDKQDEPYLPTQVSDCNPWVCLNCLFGILHSPPRVLVPSTGNTSGGIEERGVEERGVEATGV